MLFNWRHFFGLTVLRCCVFRIRIWIWIWVNFRAANCCCIYKKCIKDIKQIVTHVSAIYSEFKIHVSARGQQCRCSMHQQQENWEVGGGGVGSAFVLPCLFPGRNAQKMPVLLADFLQTGDLVWRCGNDFWCCLFFASQACHHQHLYKVHLWYG